MNFEDFLHSLDDDAVSRDVAVCPPLHALWCEKKGDWNRAHQLVQDASRGDEAWVHAYLHRKEGDNSNAAYWYRAAGKPVCRVSLDEEWQEIAKGLLVGLEKD